MHKAPLTRAALAAAAALALLSPGAAIGAQERSAAAGGPGPVPPPPDTLAAITERGRRLAAHDAAAWLGTDAFRALNPDVTGLQRYLARETPTGWVVSFGWLTPERDRFVTRYEARQERPGGPFTARELTPPAPDSGYLWRAALAHDTALRAFGQPQRPYNVAVLPRDGGEGHDGWWVYFLPAPTEEAPYPHGGDVRYWVSAAGDSILETRRMHRSVLNFGRPPEGVQSGTHTAIVDDRPEDSDVFMVLQRKPRFPEIVVSKSFLYYIQVDGTITCTIRHDFDRPGPRKP